MVKDFIIKYAGRDILQAAEDYWGSKSVRNVFNIPPEAGTGYVKGYNLSPQLQMVVVQCELKEALAFIKEAVEDDKNTISFGFRNLFNASQQLQGPDKMLPSVQLSSSDLSFGFSFPAGRKINAIIIEVHASLLKDFFNLYDSAPQIQQILALNQPYLYEEIGSAEIIEVADRIVNTQVPASLERFFFKLRAEELIYLFFVEMLKRKEVNSYPLNAEDVKKIHEVRDIIIADLSIVPNLPELARHIGMGETKLRKLFRQIFGSGPYDYYQAFRMKKAAYLIKEKQLSVSEAGYQVGFTNLSHFSRIFERYMGVKPKKYSYG